MSPAKEKHCDPKDSKPRHCFPDGHKHTFWRCIVCAKCVGWPVPCRRERRSQTFRTQSNPDRRLASRSCRPILDRAKAYNGACTALLTKDGAPIPPSTGMVRAGSLLKYPTQTVAASTVFPDLDQYEGLPIEFGRMDTSISDPSVQLQYGLRVGIPEAGQLNALETLNIRGERSVTCKGDFDKAPSAGPLPPGAPAACEEFRKMPDALERAAELDKQYGRNPDLARLPMYCAVFSLKDWYDAKDMRGTGGNDVNFAMDVPKFDSPDIAMLRDKGAIIYAIASANNVGPASAQGPNKPDSVVPETDLQYAPWSGQACNPYDTARVPRGTSNGSGVSVAANLATCSICEQGSASCKGPASRNNIVNLLIPPRASSWTAASPAKTPAIARVSIARPSRMPRWCSMRSRALSRGRIHRIPKGLIPKEPYASFVVTDNGGPRQAAQGYAYRHRARVHGEAHQERRGHQRPDRQGDQDCSARQARRQAGGVSRPAVSGRSNVPT